MKDLKFRIRLWLFEISVKFITGLSKFFKLIRFERVENNGVIDYKFIIRVNQPKIPNCDIPEQVLKDSLKWKNEGFIPNQVKEKLEDFHKNKFSVRNGYQTEEESLNNTSNYLRDYKELKVRKLKRSINENGYEIISEVGNGFIIAEKPILEPIQSDLSYYTHTLVGTLQSDAEFIRTQLSTPDLSKQNFTQDFGVSEEQMNEYLEKDMEKYSSIDEPTWVEFAAENRLYRFLDEDTGKYMERVKSAMKSKFTKTSLHPLSGVIDNVEKSIETVKSINELAKNFDKGNLKTYPTSEEGMKRIPQSKNNNSKI